MEKCDHSWQETPWLQMWNLLNSKVAQHTTWQGRSPGLGLASFLKKPQTPLHCGPTLICLMKLAYFPKVLPPNTTVKLIFHLPNVLQQELNSICVLVGPFKPQEKYHLNRHSDHKQSQVNKHYRQRGCSVKALSRGLYRCAQG